MPQYQFDERGHCRADDDSPELSEAEICTRLTEWQELTKQVWTLNHKVLHAETMAHEHVSAYKKRMQPRMEDADRFVALATAYVTHDPKFATLCDKATLNPTTVDEVRAAIDCARSYNREHFSQ